MPEYAGDAFRAERPLLLDIVDQEINVLAQKANDLGGFELAQTGSNWPKLALTGQNWL